VSPRCSSPQYSHRATTFSTSIIPATNQSRPSGEIRVEQQSLPDVPEFLAPEAWSELDELIASGDYWEMLLPSTFAVKLRR